MLKTYIYVYCMAKLSIKTFIHIYTVVMVSTLMVCTGQLTLNTPFTLFGLHLDVFQPYKGWRFKQVVKQVDIFHCWPYMVELAKARQNKFIWKIH